MSRAILRPGQVALLDKIDAALAEGCRRLVAQAPTGFGKTIVAAHRLRHLQDAGRRAIIMVPALSLVDQTVEKLFAEGVTNVGVIQASHQMTNSARPIQVATPQSLQRREIPDADEILIDEVHKWFKIYPKLLADPRFADVPIIGLTATPWSKGLGKHFDRLIVGATTAQLIEDKHLSPFRSFAPASPDLTGVRTMAGDYHEGDLAAAVNKATLVANVVETWLAQCEEPADALLRGRSGARQASPDAVSGGRRQRGIHRRLHRGIRSRRHRQTLPRWRGEGRLQRRLPYHRHRLGCPLHHPGEADQERDALRSDDRARFAYRRRQDGLPDPRPQRQPHPARFRHRHSPRRTRRW